MKSIKYLYEMESFSHIFNDEEKAVIDRYIQFQQNRLEALIQSGSMIAAYESANERKTEPFAEQSKIMIERNKGIAFWDEKRKELE